MTRAEFDALLDTLSACREARAWCAARPRMTPARLWATCPRGDWMLWLAAQVSDPDEAGIIAAAHACAMLAHDYAAASAAASDDAYAAACAAACAAARAADYAADYAAASAADYAASAAHAADAADAASDNARTLARRQCADMVRLLVRSPFTKKGVGR